MSHEIPSDLVKIWEPQPGSQELFLTCPIFEAILEGTRGGGKTDTLLMDFLQHVGTGLGVDWRGILFRRSHPELADIIAKTQKWFKQIFPTAEYNKVEKTWTFPDGEQLLLRHIRVVSDYWSYHGHAYPWIGWEELSNWPDDGPFRKMMSCCRSTNPRVPKKYRATTNPYGCVRSGEVLTINGWVDIRDFRDGDLVLTHEGYRPATLVKHHYDGDLITYETTQGYMEFTEDHRLPHVVTPKKYPDVWRLRPFNELPVSEAHIQSALPEWKGEEFTPPLGLSMEQYAVLMGWWLSEGCVVPRDKAISIAQLKYRDKLREDMDFVGHKYSYGPNSNSLVLCDREWYEYFCQFGKSSEKFIPKELLNAPTHILKLLFSRLMLGDGTFNKEDAGSYATISRQLQDDVLELCVKLGYRVRTRSRLKPNRSWPELTVWFRPARTFQMRPGTLPHTTFSGEVYCLNVPGAETFMIRQRGFVWLSGNSGHNWIKRRYRLPTHRGLVIRDAVDSEGELEPPRVALHSSIHENRLLLDADPEYLSRLRASARNEAELRAWLYGDWDIVAGGMLDDVWNSKVHVIDPFDVPRSWRIDRSFDWGSAKPFSVGWWAESDGTEVKLRDGTVRSTVRGDLFLVAEWYGGNPKEENTGLKMPATQIALGIRAREQRMVSEGLLPRQPSPGPADGAIYVSEPGTPSVAKDMEGKGVCWDRADKSPGSRVQGWQQIRKYLESAARPGRRESPGLFIFRTCHSWQEHVTVLPRDDNNMDDVDTDANDHEGDMTRYRVMASRRSITQRAF
jgi:hypothetical protein